MPTLAAAKLLALVFVFSLIGSSAAAQSPHAVFRTIDGSENNLWMPDWGKAGVPLMRATSVAYADGVSKPSGADRPGARFISNTISAQVLPRPNALGASSFLWQWGQFLDHDLDQTKSQSQTEAFPIPVPKGDRWFDPNGTGNVTIPLFRSKYQMVLRLGKLVRQQTNGITAFIDASNVYGSNATRALALRGPGGTLKTSAGDLLPFNTSRLENDPSDDPKFFLAGDTRANEQLGLIAMHTLFVREHNRLVKEIAPLGFPDDVVYEMARAIVGAEMQAITYREFLPVLLGPGAIGPYRGYRSDVQPQISNMFSTAAYRLGHSMLPQRLLRLDANGRAIAAGHVSLGDAFFAPAEISKHGIEPILRGLASQLAEEIDTLIVDGVRNFLFGPPGRGGFDLAALNIQRGRDHGLPDYNQARVDYGFSRLTSFLQMPANPVTQLNLYWLYGSVDKVDVWVGGLAEAHMPGAMVGPMFHKILKKQFERLRDADRFWYERWMPRELVQYVESMTLSRIIRLNTSIDKEIQDDVFRVR